MVSGGSAGRKRRLGLGSRCCRDERGRMEEGRGKRSGQWDGKGGRMEGGAIVWARKRVLKKKLGFDIMGSLSIK